MLSPLLIRDYQLLFYGAVLRHVASSVSFETQVVINQILSGLDQDPQSLEGSIYNFRFYFLGSAIASIAAAMLFSVLNRKLFLTLVLLNSVTIVYQVFEIGIDFLGLGL